MKKLFIGVVAAFCCLALVAPVLAEIKVGGMISTEQEYWVRSRAREAGAAASVKGPTGTDGLFHKYESVEFGMATAWNRLQVQYISEDKKIGGFIELRGGGQQGGGNMSLDTNTWNYAYMDWHLNPNFYLRVGRQTQSFSIMAPDQNMGNNLGGHALLTGFGNVHGGSSVDAVRAYVKFTDNVRMEINVINPDSDGTPASPGSAGELAVARTNLSGIALPNLPTDPAHLGIVREENVIPRIDIAVPIKFGNFSMEPAVTWSRSDYQDVAGGSDDSFDAWGVSLGAKAGFGPLTIMGEINYGENLGTQRYAGTVATPTTYTPTGTADVKIADGKELQAWLEVSFDFGPFAIQPMVGYAKYENDGDPAIGRDAAEYDITRWAYGIAFPIKIAKNFTMMPNVFYYDYDSSGTIGGGAASAQRTNDTNLGYEFLGGVWWQLIF